MLEQQIRDARDTQRAAQLACERNPSAANLAAEDTATEEVNTLLDLWNVRRRRRP